MSEPEDEDDRCSRTWKIYRAAQATIQVYGDGAGLHAAQRADELLALGDMEGRRVCYC